MRNSRKSELLIVTIVGILLFSFVPQVQGWNRRYSTIFRPLDDWFYDANGDYLNSDVGVWASETLSDLLVMYPHYDKNWNYIPIWECHHYGYILDKELSDGKRLITVFLYATGVPVLVGAPTSVGDLIFEGKMDYLFYFRFKIDVKVWTENLIAWGADDNGFDENGNVELPYYLVPLYFSEYGVELVSLYLCGYGKETALNAWNDLEPGDSAKVQIGQVATPGEEVPEWPIDYIKVY